METFKAGKNNRSIGITTTIKISVRNLVEFVLRSGDIDNRQVAGADKDAMQEGTRLHKKIQKKMGGITMQKYLFAWSSLLTIIQ